MLVHFPEWQTVGLQPAKYLRQEKDSSSKAFFPRCKLGEQYQAKGSHMRFICKESLLAGSFQEGLGAKRVSLASS